MKKRIAYDVPMDEGRLQRTIAASQAAFAAAEKERTLSRLDFLYLQGKYIQKHWWLLQGALLLALCQLLRMSGSDLYARRSLGVSAPLFVILITPELWKNRAADAMEVEGTTLYTLRQIYAARLTLFAGVDLMLLTLFFLGASAFARLTPWEMLIHFVLPFNVACCLCFHSLYSGRTGSETMAILLCILWTGAWELVVLSDRVYSSISGPVWITLLVASFGCAGYLLLRGQQEYRRKWEANAIWN